MPDLLQNRQKTQNWITFHSLIDSLFLCYFRENLKKRWVRSPSDDFKCERNSRNWRCMSGIEKVMDWTSLGSSLNRPILLKYLANQLRLRMPVVSTVPLEALSVRYCSISDWRALEWAVKTPQSITSNQLLTTEHIYYSYCHIVCAGRKASSKTPSTLNIRCSPGCRCYMMLWSCIWRLRKSFLSWCYFI